jgi:hypothetical protein
MSWINDQKNLWRGAVLVGLILAITGPWTYTSDGAPPPEWCRAPFFLMGNGRCVRSVPATEVVTFISGAFLTMSVGLVTGATVLPERAREYLGVSIFTLLLFLLILPIFTTLRMFWGGASQRMWRLHLAAWGLAAALSLATVVGDPGLRSGRFWGVWLYIGLAASALLLEMIAHRARRRLGQGG